MSWISEVDCSKSAFSKPCPRVPIVDLVFGWKDPEVNPWATYLKRFALRLEYTRPGQCRWSMWNRRTQSWVFHGLSYNLVSSCPQGCALELEDRDHVPPPSPYFFNRPCSLGFFQFRTSFSLLGSYVSHYYGLNAGGPTPHAYIEALIPNCCSRFLFP